MNLILGIFTSERFKNGLFSELSRHSSIELFSAKKPRYKAEFS